MIRSGGGRPTTPTAASTSSTRTTRTTHNPGVTPEARFAAGEPCVRSTPDDNDGNGPPSAHGLQRLTNFNRPGYYNTAGTYIQPVMPAANLVPNIFVSPEDMVWQEATNTNNVYTIGGGPGGDPGSRPPQPGRARPEYSSSLGQPNYDWRFSWMITVQQNNASNGASFDGNIVIFENRPFALDQISLGGTTVYQAAGETVYEGVFGYSKNVVSARLHLRLRRGGRPGPCSSAGTGRPRRTPSSRSATLSPT